MRLRGAQKPSALFGQHLSYPLDPRTLLSDDVEETDEIERVLAAKVTLSFTYRPPRRNLDDVS